MPRLAAEADPGNGENRDLYGIGDFAQPQSVLRLEARWHVAAPESGSLFVDIAEAASRMDAYVVKLALPQLLHAERADVEWAAATVGGEFRRSRMSCLSPDRRRRQAAFRPALPRSEDFGDADRARLSCRSFAIVRGWRSRRLRRPAARRPGHARLPRADRLGFTLQAGEARRARLSLAASLRDRRGACPWPK